MKKVLLILLALFVAISFCTSCSKPGKENSNTSTDSVANSTNPAGADIVSDSPAKNTTLEGPGYNTPEDAILAYLNAFNRGDAREMLSTFAIETYVDRFVPENYVLKMRSVSPLTSTLANCTPVSGAYSRSLLVVTRYSTLANQFFTYYGNMALQLNGMTQMISDSAGLKAIQDAFAGNAVDQWPGHVEFVEWISPTIFPKLFLPPNAAQRAAESLCCGADDLTLIAAHIRLNGQDAIQTMYCVRYGDRWYNLNTYNQIMVILGVSINEGYTGLILNDDIPAYLSAEPEAEYKAKLDNLEASGLCGTSWQLVSLSQNVVLGITVAETKDGIRERDGMSVWAEMKFLSLGGFQLDIHFTPAMDDILQSEGYPNISLYSAWSVTENGGLQLDYRVRGLQVKTFDMTDVTFERNEDTIIISWPWGMSAEFRKVP